uniref:Hyaluronidase n=1 Tax=Hemiscorpius lepturus TaxID=520031 RepID=A0A1L4BJ83_HEMLE|nr:venom toxin [Hemiscorpius lepturus]
MNWRTLIGIVLNFGVNIVAGTNFKIYWNVPSSLCSVKFGINVTETLISNGVLVNSKEEFLGDKIVIFYQNKFGKYPYIDGGNDINGGLPQLGNLTEHLRVSEDDINQIILNSSFDGLGIIDWERWRPTWRFNWANMHVYKARTLALMRQKHPDWSWEQVVNASIDWWEETTKQWMLETLELAKKMRHEGKWCYYHFPDCYNYAGKNEPDQFHCSSIVKNENDRLFWLWNSTTALCPSIYYDPRQGKYNETQKVWYLYGRLSEATRVSQPKTPIYPYINYRMRNGLNDVPKDHFPLMLSYVASLGLDGVVIWGSSEYVKSKKNCEELETYVKEVIAPAATNITSTASWCGETFCNNNGLCTWPQQPYTSWKCLIDPTACSFNPEDIACRCQVHEGRYCNITDSYSTDLL